MTRASRVGGEEHGIDAPLLGLAEDWLHVPVDVEGLEGWVRLLPNLALDAGELGHQVVKLVDVEELLGLLAVDVNETSIFAVCLVDALLPQEDVAAEVVDVRHGRVGEGLIAEYFHCDAIEDLVQQVQVPNVYLLLLGQQLTEPKLKRAGKEAKDHNRRSVVEHLQIDYRCLEIGVGQVLDASKVIHHHTELQWIREHFLQRLPHHLAQLVECSERTDNFVFL